jgi:hypothetical protein
MSGINYFKKYGIEEEIAQNITNNKGTICIHNPYYKKNKFIPWTHYEDILGAIFYVIIFDRSYTKIYLDNDIHINFEKDFGIDDDMYSKIYDKYADPNKINYYIDENNLKYIDFNITKKQMKKSRLYNSCVTTPIKSNEIKYFYIVMVNHNNQFTIIKDLWNEN